MKNSVVIMAGSWLLGITGLVSVFLFIGGVNIKTGIPDPITVDGKTIEFTWTDENFKENLHIYTDKSTYTDGLSHATVYVAIANRSGVDQDIELMGYFRDNKKRISNVAVLTEVTREVNEPVFEDRCPTSTINVAIPLEKQPEPCINAQIATNTYQVAEKEWAPLEQTDRNQLELVKEEVKLQEVTRKTVDSFLAEKKTVPYNIPADGVVYYKVIVEFPANADDNFFFEAVGSAGGYGHLDPWFDSNWDYRVKVEVNPVKVGSSTAITNFPVFNDCGGFPSTFWTNASSTGADIRIVESDEVTETAFELVYFSTSTKKCEIHFLADSLSTTSTSTFYVYYGNPAATAYAVSDPFGSEAVWGTSVYRMVQHFDGPTAASLDDSTSYNHDVAVEKSTPLYQQTGKIGRSYFGDGGDVTPDGFELTNTANLGGATVSFSAWVYFTGYTDGSRFAALFSRTNAAVNNGFTFFRGNAGNSGAMLVRLDNNNYVSSHTIPDSQWVHLVWTHTSNQTEYYINGELKQTQTTEAIITGGTQTVGLGLNAWAFNDPLKGYMDEARLGFTTLSTSWVITEYNNQSATSSFFYIGAEETEPAGGGSSPLSTGIWYD